MPTQTVSLDTELSFIVKFFLERAKDQGQEVQWHGHITHVPSGERRYFKDLDAILQFIMQTLRGQGVHFGLSRRLRNWIFRLKTLMH